VQFFHFQCRLDRDEDTSGWTSACIHPSTFHLFFFHPLLLFLFLFLFLFLARSRRVFAKKMVDFCSLRFDLKIALVSCFIRWWWWWWWWGEGEPALPFTCQTANNNSKQIWIISSLFILSWNWDGSLWDIFLFFFKWETLYIFTCQLTLNELAERIVMITNWNDLWPLISWFPTSPPFLLLLLLLLLLIPSVALTKVPFFSLIFELISDLQKIYSISTNDIITSFHQFCCCPLQNLFSSS